MNGFETFSEFNAPENLAAAEFSVSELKDLSVDGVDPFVRICCVCGTERKYPPRHFAVAIAFYIEINLLEAFVGVVVLDVQAAGMEAEAGRTR